MRLLVISTVALALLSPAAASAAQSSRYEEGVAARGAGQNDRAIALLQEVVSAESDNADAHLQLGLALLAAGRLTEAERSLLRTLELAPNYQDAKDGLARLGDRRRARMQEEYLWRLDVDGAYSFVAQGNPDWVDSTIRVRRRLDDGRSITAMIEPSHRFNATDVYGELRIEQRLAGGASAWALVGATPQADFRPMVQVGAGGALPVSSGSFATVLTIEGRHADFPESEVQTLVAGIEQYVGDGSWLTGRIINLFDDGQHHSGWLGRGDWLVTEHSRLFVGAADAPDTSEGVVTRVFSVFGGLSANVSDRTTLRLSLTREERKGSSDRLQLAVGMGLNF